MKESNGKIGVAEWRQQLTDSISSIEKKLDKFLAPGGVCDTHRQMVKTNRQSIKVHWILFAAVIAALIKEAFF